MADAFQPFDQGSGLQAIPALTRRWDQPQRQSERVDGSVNFAREAAAGAADALSLSPPPCARSIGVGFANGAIDQDVFKVGIIGQGIEKALPAPGPRRCVMNATTTIASAITIQVSGRTSALISLEAMHKNVSIVIGNAGVSRGERLPRGRHPPRWLGHIRVPSWHDRPDPWPAAPRAVA